MLAAPHRWFAAALLCLGCSFAVAAAPASPVAAAPPGAGAVPLPPHEPHTLRVLQLNIWQEGTSVPHGFDRIIDIIVASDADVVTLSEVRNYHHTDLHQRIVAALAQRGKTFHGEYVPGTDAGMVTRLPLVSASLVDTQLKTDDGSVVGYRVTLPNGKPLFVASAHLDYKHYGCYLPRGYSPHSFKLIDADHDGKPDVDADTADVLAADRRSGRRGSIAAFLDYIKNNDLSKSAVILAGDFNEASSLDWTAATKDLFDHHGAVIPWDESTTLFAAGFTDAWRQVYPDPVTHPGMTWPSTVLNHHRTTWAPLADERDRVDYIYTNGVGLKAVRAWLVGPDSYWVRNKPQVSESKDPFVLGDVPWPTDHKGVLVDFALTP